MNRRKQIRDQFLILNNLGSRSACRIHSILNKTWEARSICVNQRIIGGAIDRQGHTLRRSTRQIRNLSTTPVGVPGRIDIQ